MTREASVHNNDRAASDPNDQKDPIAIIGIGCRFPGGVDTPEKFWQLLVDEVDAITKIPDDRVDVAPFYDPLLASPGKVATDQGGFLDQVDQFDPSFFGISPREADTMDPQQRLLLEVAWEALEDAGQRIDRLRASKTGVFIGMWTNDYADKMYRATQDITLYMTTGGGRYAASGRLSYFFDFRGPSLTIDTQCSSSLVSVHMACQSLRMGDSNLALAGGANLILEPTISIGYSRSKMLAPDGRCKFGDASANGYVRSEGVGLVVLKRLADAVADHDPIYAVILGSAVNNDGQSSGELVAPGIPSQSQLLRDSCQNAAISPSQIGYAEAHGTGTPVGDPVELQALGTVLSEGRDASRPCRLGSVKTNIGHTEAAAGVAGLIKTALCIQHRAIPASLHFQHPNPKIHWAALPLRVQTQWTPWPEDLLPAVASVSSFGITGTNANVILAEDPREVNGTPSQDVDGAFLLPLSAQTPEALRALAGAYQDLLGRKDAPSLADLCYTASCRRIHHTERLAFSGKTPEDLVEQLSNAAAAPTSSADSKVGVDAKVVFVFPGQGAQWTGMGRELLKHNPVFHETLARCDEAIRKWADWSLLEQLALDEADPGYRLNEISVIQPALFAIEVALANVWRSWGVEPAAVIGHSMGEVAAAFLAGKVSLEDAAHVICKRSQLMQRTSGKGAMAVIGLPYDEADLEIQLNGLENQLSIAVQNSPRSTVIAGDPKALETLMESLRAREIFCRPIKVDVASHSPQMDPLRPELVDALRDIQPLDGTIPFYSTATQGICKGSALDAEYWGRNLRQPVRFSSTVQRLLEDGHTIFIEMSPHPILLSAIEETCKHLDRPGRGFASLRRGQPERITLLGELGALYTSGYPVAWEKLYPHGGAVVSLPSYPWQRERHWFEDSSTSRQPEQPTVENREAAPQRKDIRAELLAVEPGRQRQALLDAFVRDHVAQVLRMVPSRIPADKPLKTLGLDSLMSVDLRNRLEGALGISLAASLTYNYPTVSALVTFLAEKAGIQLEPQGQNAREEEPRAVRSDLDQLGRDELEALLADELSAVDETLKGSGRDTQPRAK